MRNQFHFLLMQTFNLSNRAVHRQTSLLKLDPGQPKILQVLLENGPMAPKEIADRLVLDKSTTTQLLGRMEQKGLISKAQSESDRRSVIICLTPEGREMAEKVLKIGEQVDSTALSGFTREESLQLMDLLAKAAENLHNEQ